MKKLCLLIITATLLGLCMLSGAEAQKATNAFPTTVTDSAGHEATLQARPQRIGCLYAFCGHVVTMLDRGQDMVAIINGLKKDMLLNQLVPAIKTMPVPAKGGVINIEALVKTKPDIVFLKPETAAISAEIKKLERFSLPYFTAGYHSMTQQMDIIEKIGQLIGRHEKALAYTAYYRDVIKRTQKRTAHLRPENKIRVYHSVNEPTRTDGAGTIEADWTAAAGIINVSVGGHLRGRANKNFADIEQILIWNPDIIIVNESGVDQDILSDPKWTPIKAVQDKKVYGIPVGISRWGHPGGLETPLAILWTAKTVYPELFSDIDLQKEVHRFYKTFFNLNLSPDMVHRILKNEGMRTGS